VNLISLVWDGMYIFTATAVTASFRYAEKLYVVTSKTFLCIITGRLEFVQHLKILALYYNTQSQGFQNRM